MYADDYQFYVLGDTCTDVVVYVILVDCAKSASIMYKSNLPMGNLDKFQTLLLVNKNLPMNNIVIYNYEVKSTQNLNLLEVEIDDNLSFN